MTDRDLNDTPLSEAVKLLMDHGEEALAGALEILLNHVMQLERERHLQASPYERTSDRLGYANGYKNKQLKSRVGSLDLQIPQTRGTGFYPSSLERGLRSERALKLALAEMYVQGVSTRKVAAITEQLCGFSVTSMEVSRCAAALDEELEAWRNRPLGSYRYVVLDARYEKTRYGAQVTDQAALLAVGVRATDGKREVLGCSVQLSEAEVHWRQFLQHLQQRGLSGVELIVSDDHEGLKAARRAVFPSVPWQRCQVHLLRNAQAYIARRDQRAQLMREMKAILAADTAEQAHCMLKAFVERNGKRHAKLTAWAERAFPEGFAVYRIPYPHRRRMRTTNLVERLNREIKRRTAVAGIFPNDESCLRLITAIAMETSDEWLSGRAYLNMDVEP